MTHLGGNGKVTASLPRKKDIQQISLDIYSQIITRRGETPHNVLESSICPQLKMPIYTHAENENFQTFLTLLSRKTRN